MPKTVLSRSLDVSSAKHSDTYELVSVALFSGIGLLLSLTSVMLGARAFWF